MQELNNAIFTSSRYYKGVVNHDTFIQLYKSDELFYSTDDLIEMNILLDYRWLIIFGNIGYNNESS